MRQLLPDLAPLQRPGDFRLLYLGQAVSGFGSAVTYVVLPVQMYQLTKSSVMVGLLGVAEFVPMLLMAATLAALTVNALQPAPQVNLLFAAAAFLAALNSVHRPAIEAMTPQLVRIDEMTAVSALHSIRHNIAYIAGPGLAGWIAVRYRAAIAALLAMRQKVFQSGEEGAITWHSLGEGWRYALERKDLLGTYLIDMNAMFFGMPNALFPAFGAIFGERNVGWLYSAGPIGALLCSLTSGWAKYIVLHGQAIAWAAGLWGVAIIGFGFSTNLWLALFFLACAGAADMVSGIFRGTLWNQTIPARLRGRTAAIEMVSYLSGPYLGNAEAGFAARLLGLGPSVVMGGVLCVVGSVAITWALPAFRQYRAPSAVPPPS